MKEMKLELRDGKQRQKNMLGLADRGRKIGMSNPSGSSDTGRSSVSVKGMKANQLNKVSGSGVAPWTLLGLLRVGQKIKWRIREYSKKQKKKVLGLMRRCHKPLK